MGLSLFGIEPADVGEIVFNGSPVHVTSPQQALRIGIAYVSEDRRALGLVMPMSITSNISLPMLREYLSALGLINFGAEKKTAMHYRERLSIRTQTVDVPVAKLSGGNQQKVMLSKWLNAKPQSADSGRADARD